MSEIESTLSAQRVTSYTTVPEQSALVSLVLGSHTTIVFKRKRERQKKKKDERKKNVICSHHFVICECPVRGVVLSVYMNKLS